MRAIVILSVILVGAFCAATAEKQLVRDLFSQWKLAHGKTYKAGHEEEHRFNVFLRNYITIQTHNQKNSGVTLALNQFADLTKEEFTHLYTGELPTTQHETNNAKASSFENVKLPESVDWRTKGAVAPIRNQLACGSCWAFSAVANLESFYYINHGELPILSPQNLVDCDTASFGCNGGWKFTAFTYSAKNGLERDSDYPYTARTGKCAFESSKAIKLNTGYTNVTTKSAVALKTAVVDQPVTVSIQANESVFQFYRSGVITSGCGKSTNHAVLVVGYDTFNNVEAFIVKNSWGTVWGNQGYVLISTDESQNQGLGVCGILYTPAFPTGK